MQAGAIDVFDGGTSANLAYADAVSNGDHERGRRLLVQLGSSRSEHGQTKAASSDPFVSSVATAIADLGSDERDAHRRRQAQIDALKPPQAGG